MIRLKIDRRGLVRVGWNGCFNPPRSIPAGWRGRFNPWVLTQERWFDRFDPRVLPHRHRSGRFNPRVLVQERLVRPFQSSRIGARTSGSTVSILEDWRANVGPSFSIVED
jgi:hypothetical protein